MPVWELQKKDARYLYAAFAVIVAAAAWWRLTNLANPGLWLDEIMGVPGIGPEHGPIHYAMMRATTGAHPNELLTRLPFALAGIIGVTVACFVGCATSGLWLGISVRAFVATSPVHLYYSREARPQRRPDPLRIRRAARRRAPGPAVAPPLVVG